MRLAQVLDDYMCCFLLLFLVTADVTWSPPISDTHLDDIVRWLGEYIIKVLEWSCRLVSGHVKSE